MTAIEQVEFREQLEDGLAVTFGTRLNQEPQVTTYTNCKFMKIERYSFGWTNPRELLPEPEEESTHLTWWLRIIFRIGKWARNER